MNLLDAERFVSLIETMRTHDLYEGEGALFYDGAAAGDRSEIGYFNAFAADGDCVVDLAAGSGRLTLPLARRAARVIAVDSSTVLTDELRARVAIRDLPDGRVEVVTADALDWDPACDVSLVVMGATSIALFDEERRARLLRRIARWIAPTGRFAFTLDLPDAGGDGDDPAAPSLVMLPAAVGDGPSNRLGIVFLVDDPRATQRTSGLVVLDVEAPCVAPRVYTSTVFKPTAEQIEAELEAAGLRIVERTALATRPSAAGRRRTVVGMCCVRADRDARSPS